MMWSHEQATGIDNVFSALSVQLHAKDKRKK